MGRPYASWGRRLGAYILDLLIGLVIYLVGIIQSSGTATVNLDGTMQGSYSAMTILGLVIIAGGGLAYFIYNVVHLQGTTGQTIGKKALGIAVLGMASGTPIGRWRVFLRQLAHILDWMPCYLGFLWPLWDRENRTFADMLCKTRVYRM